MSRASGLWARFGLVLAFFTLAAGLFQVGSATEVARVIPAPAADEPAAAGSSEVAVLAGGCFWGIQAYFSTSPASRARSLGMPAAPRLPRTTKWWVAAGPVMPRRCGLPSTRSG